MSRRAAMMATAGTADDEAFYEAARKKTEKLIPHLQPRSRVLDLGCGIGRFERFIAPHCAHITGVDPTPGFIRIATRENADLPNADFRLGTSSDLSGVQSSSIDFLFSLGVFERLPKSAVRRYLAEIHRALCPAGRAYLEFLIRMAPRTVSRDGNVWNASVYSLWGRDEVREAVEGTGFVTLATYEEPPVLTLLLEKTTSGRNIL